MIFIGIAVYSIKINSFPIKCILIRHRVHVRLKSWGLKHVLWLMIGAWVVAFTRFKLIYNLIGSFACFLNWLIWTFALLAYCSIKFNNVLFQLLCHLLDLLPRNVIQNLRLVLREVINYLYSFRIFGDQLWWKATHHFVRDRIYLFDYRISAAVYVEILTFFIFLNIGVFSLIIGMLALCK